MQLPSRNRRKKNSRISKPVNYGNRLLIEKTQLFYLGNHRNGCTIGCCWFCGYKDIPDNSSVGNPAKVTASRIKKAENHFALDLISYSC
jgi:hypothetical protein